MLNSLVAKGVLMVAALTDAVLMMFLLVPTS